MSARGIDKTLCGRTAAGGWLTHGIVLPRSSCSSWGRLGSCPYAICGPRRHAMRGKHRTACTRADLGCGKRMYLVW